MWIILALLVFTGKAALAEKKKISLGITYGVFVPSSGSTRSIFGHSWFGLSGGVIDREKPNRWEIAWDFNIRHHERAGEVSLYPLTIGVHRGLGKVGFAQPYVALRAGPYYGEARADVIGVRGSTLGLNANAALGVIFQERFYLEARYDYFSRFARSSFDGLTLTAGVRLFDFGL
jgi:hypothetical protein